MFFSVASSERFRVGPCGQNPMFCQATFGSHATETTGVVCRGEVVVSLKVQGGPDFQL